ncbi:MAG: hypothetical protein IH571_02550, partial [Acholeplasmataceae bacterium]|nr:hypothetical protein [Acholeplasmataceae bacterium]
MKTLSKTVLIIIFVGLALTIIAFFMGLNTNALVSFFNVDEEYGEQLTYTHDE